MSRYQLIREGGNYPNDFWGVQDTLKDIAILSAESFTIASTLCDTLNNRDLTGGYLPSEIDEIATAMAHANA